MASIVIRDLLESVSDIAITAADLRHLNFLDPRVRPAVVDVRDVRSTTDIIAKHDAILNCVNYYFNIPIMQAALAAGVPYTDLGGLYHGSMKQFALHDEFLQKGLTAVIGMGSTPGITNVMAGVLAREMDEVHELHVRVGCFDQTASGPLPVPYALDTVLDEFAMEPMVFSNGTARAVPPMSGMEMIEFPPPVGKMHALYTLHSEVAMFPRSFPGLKEATFKVAFPEEFTHKIKFLVELGFASREKIVQDVSAREMLLALTAKQPAVDAEPQDCDVLRVHAKGVKSGRIVESMAESIILPHPKWKVPAGSLDTGVPLSIVGQMLARGEIKQAGILCPETSVPPEAFFAELAKRGIKVQFN
jgi:saccharopine dehydrogenase-like NADP-dependent oxidoreductase